MPAIPPLPVEEAFNSEVADRLGLVPNVFLTASAGSGLRQELWALERSAYLDNPLPSLFKERLFVHLSRLCPARYCIVRHVGFLVGLGRPAGDAQADAAQVQDVIAFLERPLPDAAALALSLQRLHAGGRLAALPAPDAQQERDLFDALSAVFVEPGGGTDARAALAVAVDGHAFEWLTAFLAFVRTAHFWTEAHPELGFEQDVLDLMQRQPRLKELLLDATDAGRIRDRVVPVRIDDLRETLRATQERQAFLLALSDVLRPLSDPGAIQGAAMQALGRHLRAHRALYFDVDPDQDTVVAGPAYVEGVAPMPVPVRISQFGGELRDLFMGGGTLVVEDVRTDLRWNTAPGDGRWQQAFDGIGVRAAIAIPLLKDGVLVAILSVHQSSPRHWRAAEVALTQDVAERTWAAVERARAEARLRESESQFRSLFDATDEAVMVIERAPRRTDGLRDWRYVAMNAKAGAMFRKPDLTGDTIRQHFPQEDETWYDVYDRVLEGGQSVRLERESVPQGMVLDMYVTRVEGPQCPRLIVVMQDVTVRRRAADALQRNERRQIFLLQLSDALRPLDDAREIQDTAARKLGEHLRARRVLYYEPDPAEPGWMRVSHGYAPQPETLPVRLRISDFGPHLAGEYGAGHTVVMPDIAQHPALGEPERAAFGELGTQATLCVPLLRAGKLGAVLGVHSAQPRDWSAEDVSLVEDVAERTWVAVERARAESALREADQRKDEFLATLAHELRNPLAPISNALHLLRGERSNGDGAALRAIIERQVGHMVRLVDDLLDVSRISRGAIELRHEALDLRSALRAAVETSRPAIDRGHHTLTVELPGEALPVSGDPVRLAQIFGNLLNNAAKYSDDGGRVVLAARRDGADAVVRVSDAGIGIAADQLAHVFRLFGQVDRHHPRGQGGLGIGLNLAQRLAQMHGGGIEGASPGIGQGSVFTVRLPLAEPPPMPAPPDDPLERQELQERRVLVVDDNRDAAQTLALLLEMMGAQTRMAHSGGAALRELEQWVPDVVMMDIGMPGMDGNEAARRIRADRRFDGVRLVALTGWGQETDRQRTRAAGFDVHLTKPVSLEMLLPALRAPLAPR